MVTAIPPAQAQLHDMSSGAWTRIEVTRTHLELLSRAALRPARPPSDAPTLLRHRPIGAPEYRELYALVGERWLWRDRLVWTDDELDAYLASRNVHIWTLGVAGRTAGYFELQHHANGAVEIMYFGLAPSYMGRGL